MSKKTRKKTSRKAAKVTSGKVTRGESARSAKTSGAKTSAAKTSAAKTSAAKTSAAKTSAAKTSSAKTSAAKSRQATVNKSAKSKKSAKSPAATAAAPRPAARKATQPQRPKAAPSVDSRPALAEGAKAPAFRLPRDGGQTVSLADFSGRKLVLFFYPRADTPGCTKEAIDFTRLESKFAESHTAVLGVSADPPKVQEAFRDKHQLSVPLISDEQHEMLEAYGVWGEKSMYGKTFQGIFRTTVLIDADSRVIKIWRHVKVDGHADEVLAAAAAA